MSDASGAIVERMRIDRIEVGQRRRQHLGPIAQLAKDIEEHGLLHPIVVTDDGVLICGERRLRACEKLGWKSIPARRFGDLSLDEIRALELSENIHRLDLTTYEQNRQLVDQADQAAAEVSRQNAEKPRPKGGRPQGGNAGAARSLGVDERTIRRARKHVEAGAAYPFMQDRNWNQNEALTLGKKLDSAQKLVREAVVKMCSEAGCTPPKQKKIIANVTEMPKDEQNDWVVLANSLDVSDRSRAKTRATRTPPAPQRALVEIPSIIRSCEKLIEVKDTAGKTAVRAAISSLRDALKANEEAYARLRKQEGV